MGLARQGLQLYVPACVLRRHHLCCDRLQLGGQERYSIWYSIPQDIARERMMGQAPSASKARHLRITVKVG